MCVAGESKWLLVSCELLPNSAGGDNDVCGEAIGRDCVGICGGTMGLLVRVVVLAGVSS